MPGGPRLLGIECQLLSVALGLAGGVCAVRCGRQKGASSSPDKAAREALHLILVYVSLQGIAAWCLHRCIGGATLSIAAAARLRGENGCTGCPPKQLASNKPGRAQAARSMQHC